MSDINIAIVGLGFGAEFIPIYQRLKGVNMYAICQRTQSKLDEVGDKFGIAKRYTSYDDLLADPEVHAVHINSPILTLTPSTSTRRSRTTPSTPSPPFALASMSPAPCRWRPPWRIARPSSISAAKPDFTT